MLLRWIPFSCFFLNQTIRNSLFIFYFTIIVRKKPTTTGDKLSPVGASLTNPLLMPRHLPMQTSPPGGGGGIESRRACDVVFELGAKPQIPKGSLILFLSSCQPVKVEVDTIEPCLGHEKRRLRRTAFAKKQLPVCR